MKPLFTLSTLVAAFASAPQVLAGEGGSCHFHGSQPATEGIVKDCADQRRAALVKRGKLNASWGSAKQEALELVDGKKGKEWKVRHTNPAEADKTKQSLFVFLPTTATSLRPISRGNKW